MKRTFAILFLVNIAGNTLLYSQNWQSVGNGTTYYARCIHADTTNNLLYVGGMFAYADTVKVNGIGKWDGTRWYSVGRGDTTCTGGCSNSVTSITQLDTDIFAGGFFQTMGGAPNTRFLARWDGTNWNGLGNINSQIELKILNNKVYAMGLYSSIGGIPANSIASWDGNNWSDVYGFPNLDPWGNVNQVTAVEDFQGDLYVGGIFDNLNNMTNIARWNGTDWVSLQNGINGGLAYVNRLVTYKNELYVGGWFEKTDGNAGNFLMVWNGTTWREFSPNINYGGPVYDMKIINNQLYIVGAFNFLGDTAVYGMAKYDGSTFSAFGGANHWATQIAGLGNNIYVITDNVIGSDTVHYVAQWMGGNLVDSSVAVLAGIADITSEDSFNIYPNPCSNQITIEFNSTEIKNISLEIKNILGQSVKSISGNQFQIGINKIEMDISLLSKGIYFVQLQSRGSIISQKLIKE